MFDGRFVGRGIRQCQLGQHHAEACSPSQLWPQSWTLIGGSWVVTSGVISRVAINTSPGQSFDIRRIVQKCHEHVPRRSGEARSPFYVASVAE